MTRHAISGRTYDDDHYDAPIADLGDHARRAASLTCAGRVPPDQLRDALLDPLGLVGYRDQRPPNDARHSR